MRFQAILIPLCFFITLSNGIAQQSSDCPPFPISGQDFVPLLSCDPVDFKMERSIQDLFPIYIPNDTFSINNPYIYAFNAGENLVRFTLAYIPENCSPGYDIIGLQVFVVPVIECGSDPLAYIRNHPYSRQYYVVYPGFNLSVNLDFLEACKTYYLIIDGLSGAACEPYITLSGDTEPVSKSLSIGSISGNAADLSISLVPNVQNNDGTVCPNPDILNLMSEGCIKACNCGSGNGAGCNILAPFEITSIDHPDTWDVSYSPDAQNGFNLSIQNIDQSADVCIQYKYDFCESSLCFNIEFSSDTIYICPGESISWGGHTITSAGNYTQFPADLEVEQLVVRLKEELEIVQEEILLCPDEVWIDPLGQSITSAGIYQYSVEFPDRECPVYYEYHIDFIESPYLVKDSDLDCYQEKTLLSVHTPTQLLQDGQISITWFDPQGNVIAFGINEIQVELEGIYKVIVSYSGSNIVCQWELSVEVFKSEEYEPILLITSNDDPVCYGETYKLTFLTNAENVQIYQGMELLENLSGLEWISPPLFESTCYKILMSNNNGTCSKELEYCIEVLPEIPETIVEASICAGSIFSWQSNTLTTAGIYTAHLQSSEGCDSILKLNLEVIQPTHGTDTVLICPGLAYQIGNSQYPPGSHEVRLTNHLGCDSILYLLVETIPDWQLSAKVTPTCIGKSEGSIELFTEPAMTQLLFEWSPEVSSGNTAMALSEGWYQVTVTDIQGCDKSMLIEITGLDCSNPGVSIFHETCPGLADGRLEISEAIPGLTYLLNNLAANGDHVWTNLDAGSYVLSAKMNELEIFNETYVVHAGVMTTPYMTDPVMVQTNDQDFVLPVSWNNWSANCSIIWSPLEFFDDSLSPTPILNQINSLDSISVKVISESGCMYERSYQIQFIQDSKIFSPTAFTPNGDGINDLWKLYASADRNITVDITIFDRWESEVYTCTQCHLEDVQWDGKFKNITLDNGLFIYQASIFEEGAKAIQLNGEISLLK